MNAFLLLPQYGHWHYSRGLKDYIDNWRGIQSFVFRFFSFSILLKTMFVPWRRLSDTDEKGGIEGFFSALIVNLLMRFVGLCVRSVVIIFGMITWVVVFFVGLFGLAVWILFPFVIAFLVALVIKQIIQ